MKIITTYDLCDRVYVDGDSSIKGVITGMNIRGDRSHQLVQYEVAWFHNGNSQSAWVEEWRLTYADKS